MTRAIRKQQLHAMQQKINGLQFELEVTYLEYQDQLEQRLQAEESLVYAETQITKGKSEYRNLYGRNLHNVLHNGRMQDLLSQTRVLALMGLLASAVLTFTLFQVLV